MKTVWLLLLGIALAHGSVAAQTQAPHVCGGGPGPNEVMAAVHPGGNGVGPTPLCYWKSESQQQPAGPQWETRWGAIVVDAAEPSAGIGAASGKTSKRRAEKAALADCKARGGRNCEVSLSYYNQCAVLIAGVNYNKAHGAATEEQAAETGMRECGQKGVQSCQVYWSDCSHAEQVQ